MEICISSDHSWVTDRGLHGEIGRVEYSRPSCRVCNSRWDLHLEIEFPEILMGLT